MDRNDVLDVLRNVYDPELGVNVVDLGLVYGVQTGADGLVQVDMTLTSPGCPLGSTIEQEVRETFRLLPGVRALELRLVWDPPWSPERITPEGKRALGWG